MMGERMANGVSSYHRMRNVMSVYTEFVLYCSRRTLHMGILVISKSPSDLHFRVSRSVCAM